MRPSRDEGAREKGSHLKANVCLFGLGSPWERRWAGSTLRRWRKRPAQSTSMRRFRDGVLATGEGEGRHPNANIVCFPPIMSRVCLRYPLGASIR